MVRPLAGYRLFFHQFGLRGTDDASPWPHSRERGPGVPGLFSHVAGQARQRRAPCTGLDRAIAGHRRPNPIPRPSAKQVLARLRNRAGDAFETAPALRRWRPGGARSSEPGPMVASARFGLSSAGRRGLRYRRGRLIRSRASWRPRRRFSGARPRFVLFIDDLGAAQPDCAAGRVIRISQVFLEIWDRIMGWGGRDRALTSLGGRAGPGGVPERSRGDRTLRRVDKLRRNAVWQETPDVSRGYFTSCHAKEVGRPGESAEGGSGSSAVAVSPLAPLPQSCARIAALGRRARAGRLSLHHL